MAKRTAKATVMVTGIGGVGDDDDIVWRWWRWLVLSWAPAVGGRRVAESGARKGRIRGGLEEREGQQQNRE
nr:hypothetical protein [Tanacetum cinerariifolium]